MTEQTNRERIIWGDETDLTNWSDEDKARWLAARDAAFERENPFDADDDWSY